MPLSYEESQAIAASQISSFSDDAIKAIDTKLSNPQYVRDWICNEEENPTWRFSFIGSFTEGEKSRIVNAYKRVGWGTVEVMNSEEQGERAGACGVTLKRF